MTVAHSTLDDICATTTFGALERATHIAPDVEAIVASHDRCTYAELASRVTLVRSALAAHGISRGDHVALCLGNSSRWVEVFVAVSSLGAVLVPINTRFRPDEMAYVLRQSRSTTLITADRFLSSDFIGMLRDVAPEIDSSDATSFAALPDLRSVIVIGSDVPAATLSWDAFLARAEDVVVPTATPDDIALIQYTSGTTSFPKGVLLSHRSMCANGFFSGGRLGLRIADRFHSARPFFHVAGSTLSILACLQHASTLVTMDRFEPGEVLRLFEEERCTHFSGNDTIALMILGHPDVNTRKRYLRGAWVAASSSIVRQVIDVLGATECVVGYGLSEASPNVAQSAWWESEEVRVSTAMLIEPGVEVAIHDPNTGEPVVDGHAGAIRVRGWNVMAGYHDNPEVTAATIDEDGWLDTGDLGRLDETGRLVFTGRTKEVIRVGGENVAPAEVENALHAHPSIVQAVVVGVPDDRLVEVPFAFLKVAENADLELSDLTMWCKKHIAGFRIPRYFEIVDDFDAIGMTASGKVRKTDATKVARNLLDNSSTSGATR